MADRIKDTVDYLFRNFDRDNDGFVTISEFLIYINSSSSPNKADYEFFFNHYDVNKDGRIAREEWFEILAKAWGVAVPQPRTEIAAQASQPQQKPEPQVVVAVDPKAETKQEVKTEVKVDPNVVVATETKEEVKTEEHKEIVKVDPVPQICTKTTEEVKEETREEVKPEEKEELKVIVKVDPIREEECRTIEESKVVPKVETNEEVKIEVKLDPKVVITTETKEEVKTEEAGDLKVAVRIDPVPETNPEIIQVTQPQPTILPPPVPQPDQGIPEIAKSLAASLKEGKIPIPPEQWKKITDIVDFLYAGLDKDNDNELSTTEISEYFDTFKRSCDREAVFKALDDDNSGKISKTEFSAMLILERAHLR